MHWFFHFLAPVSELYNKSFRILWSVSWECYLCYVTWKERWRGLRTFSMDLCRNFGYEDEIWNCQKTFRWIRKRVCLEKGWQCYGQEDGESSFDKERFIIKYVILVGIRVASGLHLCLCISFEELRISCFRMIHIPSWNYKKHKILSQFKEEISNVF